MERNEDMGDKYSYEALNDYFDNRGGGGFFEFTDNHSACIFPDSKAFIKVITGSSEDIMESEEGMIFFAYGLKFHISLPEDNKEQFNTGWRIISKILIENDINMFKVIRRGRKVSEDPEQRGKDITIYVGNNPEKTLEDWKDILQQITEQLTLAGITPGYRAPGTVMKPEKPIPGSNYLTYHYHDEKTDASIWPEIDPLENSSFKIEVSNQLPIPEWKSVDSVHQDSITNRK